MEILWILGNILANHMDISPPAARGLLKLAIKDEFGPFKPLDEINYDELELSITQSLSKRLEILDVLNTRIILDDLISELNKHQSIITIESV